MTTLVTPRLVLRPVRLTDAPALQRHFGTWDIIQHMSLNVPWPYPSDGAERFLVDYLLPAIGRGDALCWAVTLRDGDDEAIGLLEFRRAADTQDHRGFWLGTPFHGQGLMTEAVTAFQDHIFFELGVERIFVHNALENAASRRVKEKTGAELVGVIEAQHHTGGGQTQRWVVTRERWAQLRGR